MSSEASGGVTIKEEASTTSGPVSNSPGEVTGTEAKKPESTADKAESQSEVSVEEKPETHSQRLQNLRKELGYLSETDWMYESLDKKPAQ